MKPISLMLVEDDPDIREGLAYLLGSQPTLALRGVFADAEAAFTALADGLDTQVALIDLGLPGRPGIDLIRHLKVARPDTDSVVLTIFDDDDTVFAALRAGAAGYLLKDTLPEGLVAGIQQVAAGGAPMSPSIARRVVATLHARPSEPSTLTPRERELLDLLVVGATYELAAEALHIGVGTVQTHIKSIYRKLEVCTKAEAVAEAFRRGLVTDG